MTLLDRARERRDRLRGENIADIEQATRRAIGDVVVHANRILELGDVDRITAGMVSLAPGRHPLRNGAQRNLFAFTYEGLDFVAGFYWHVFGSSGADRFLLAVRVAIVRGLPEWPPPSPADYWAPAGYKRIRALHQLADAIDVAEPAPGAR